MSAQIAFTSLLTKIHKIGPDCPILMILYAKQSSGIKEFRKIFGSILSQPEVPLLILNFLANLSFTPCMCVTDNITQSIFHVI